MESLHNRMVTAIHNSNNRRVLLCSLTFSTPEFDDISTAAQTFDELVILAHVFEGAPRECDGDECKLIGCVESHGVRVYGPQLLNETINTRRA
jgi:hypothetical protein